MTLCLSVYSQSNDARFTVIKVGNKYSKEALTVAFQKADMCGHYYFSKSNDIIFDDGSVVRLFSKKEMSQAPALSDNCFLADDVVMVKNIVWSITSNGYIAKGYNSTMNAKHESDKL